MNFSNLLPFLEWNVPKTVYDMFRHWCLDMFSVMHYIRSGQLNSLLLCSLTEARQDKKTDAQRSLPTLGKSLVLTLSCFGIIIMPTSEDFCKN